MRDNTRPKNEQNINKQRWDWCDICRKASKGIGGSFEVLNFAIENGILFLQVQKREFYKNQKEQAYHEISYHNTRKIFTIF